MFNSSFRLEIINLLTAYNCQIFGGAVRDFLSGDLFSPEWHGDVDVLYPHQNKGMDMWTRMFLCPSSTIQIVSMERLCPEHVRMSLQSKNTNEIVSVDFIDNRNGFRYSGYNKPGTDDTSLDLDVNGLVMSRLGIFIRQDIKASVPLFLPNVLYNIKQKQFEILKPLPQKRIEKISKLYLTGWQCVKTHC